MNETHLHHEHHLESSDLLTDIVIGMSDGLTVPFALAAGLSGAVNSTAVIILAGIAEIAAVQLPWVWVVTWPVKLNRIITAVN